MALDPVPWFVGGGAQHSSGVARLALWIATGGQEGVLAATDLAVVQDSPAGGSVQVLPGAGVAVSKYPGVSKESYAFRNLTQTAVPITPTGAGSGRSDLVIARVRDPSVSTPSDPVPVSIPDGPYIFLTTVSNVPNTTKSVHQVAPALGYTAVTLARIDIPANTATITQAMIKDLRTVANTYTGAQPAPEAEGSNEAESVVVTRYTNSNGATANNTRPYTDTAWKTFPAEASWTITIPKWATACDVVVNINNVRLKAGDVAGNQRVVFGGTVGPTTLYDLNNGGGTDLPNKHNWTSNSMPIGGKFSIPSAMRGTQVNVRAELSQFNNGVSSGTLYAESYTQTFLTINFKQDPALA